MNVHLLHHWLVSMRGGEKVLEQFCRLFPYAPVHTLIFNDEEKAISNTIKSHDIQTTFLNGMPGAIKHYKSMLPLFPVAINRHKVEADFIISSDAGLMKGIDNVNNAPHVCYCHSPPRYLWDLQHEYLKNMSSGKKVAFKKATPHLRRFDRYGANKVDHFIANSSFVQERIKRIYKCDSTVIHPPVNLEAFNSDQPAEDFFLIVSALVPYKKVELAVKAFNQLGKKLIIIGDGSERNGLEKIASENIVFKGSISYRNIVEHFEHCRAFIFPGIEDFGITPLEAQASGKPVIAFKKGGALETVKEGETGLFFEVQTTEALIDAITRFENTPGSFSPVVCRKNAERFSPEKFRMNIKKFLNEIYPLYFKI